MPKDTPSADEAILKGLCSQCRERPLATGRKLFCDHCLAKRRAAVKARALRKKA